MTDTKDSDKPPSTVGDSVQILTSRCAIPCAHPNPIFARYQYAEQNTAVKDLLPEWKKTLRSIGFNNPTAVSTTLSCPFNETRPKLSKLRHNVFEFRHGDCLSWYMCTKQGCPAWRRTLFSHLELDEWKSQLGRITALGQRLGHEMAIKALVDFDGSHWAQDGSQKVIFTGASLDVDLALLIKSAIETALEDDKTRLHLWQ